MPNRKKSLVESFKNSLIYLYKKNKCYQGYIVYIDGGICSQMSQYMIGDFLKERGYEVKYDISWFKKSGRDMQGLQARRFDLVNLCKSLKVEIASKKEIFIFKILFYYKNNNISKDTKNGNLEYIPKAPLYLDGYYHMGLNQIQKYDKIFKFDCNTLELLGKNKEIYRQICNEKCSVGIHVRRGDMALKGYYWKVLKPAYFVEAIKEFDIEKSHYYFFSDDLEWVMKEIIPIIPNIKYTIVDNNNSDKGYIDLFLLSCCKHQISSQGSFGGTSFLFNNNKNKMLVAPAIDGKSFWKNAFPDNRVKLIELTEEMVDN